MIDGTVTTVTGDLSDPTTTSGVVKFVPTAEQQIAAGTTKTYELKVVVGTGTTSGTYLMSSIASDAIKSTGAGGVVFSDLGNFVWSDMSAQGHSTATADWTNGYLVKNLPTDTQSLIGSN